MIFEVANRVVNITSHRSRTIGSIEIQAEVHYSYSELRDLFDGPVPALLSEATLAVHGRPMLRGPVSIHVETDAHAGWLLKTTKVKFFEAEWVEK